MRPNSVGNWGIGACLAALAAAALFAEHRWTRNRIGELESTSERRADTLELICSQLALLQELSRYGNSKRSEELERLVGQARGRIGRSSDQEALRLHTAVAALDGLIKARREKPDATRETVDSNSELYKKNFLEFDKAVDKKRPSEAEHLLGDGNVDWLGYVRSYDSAKTPPEFNIGPTQTPVSDDLIVSGTLSRSLSEKYVRSIGTVQISQQVRVKGLCIFRNNQFVIPSATEFEVISPK